MLTGLVLAGLLTPAFGAGCPREVPDPPPAASESMLDLPHARPSLIADVAAYQPGKPFTLGVSFEIDDHWHIYWDGANDSGFAPTIDLRLPDGWRVGPWQWPAPIRHETAPGQILDFIYEGRVTIFTEVTPPSEASGEVSLTASLEWLVCREACIPGDAVVSLSLRQGTLQPSAFVTLFDEARSRLPQPLGDEAPKAFSWSWTRGSLRITPHDDVSLTFAPSAEMPPLTNRFRSTRSKPGETLVIGLGRGGDKPGVHGVLEVFDAQGKTQAIYTLSVTPGTVPGAPGSDQETRP